MDKELQYANVKGNIVDITIEDIDNVKVTGNVFVVSGKRLSDILNNSELRFIPVSDASVYSSKGEFLYQQDFLNVNKDWVKFVYEGIYEPEG